MNHTDYGAVLLMQKKDVEGLTRAVAVSLLSAGLECTASQRWVFNHWSFRGASPNIDCNTDIISKKNQLFRP